MRMQGADRSITDGDLAAPSEPRTAGDWELYLNVLENITLGIILVDMNAAAVLFRNRAAKEILAAFAVIPDYRGILGALSLTDDEGSVASADKSPQKIIRHAEKLYGYTHYRIPGGYLCIFLLDITEKSRLMAIAESVNAMNNLGYIFAGIRHEIENPLNSLKMTLSVLRNNIDRFRKASVLEYVERAQAEVRRMEYLLHSMKSFNMHESPVPRNMRVSSFLADFTALVREDVTTAGVRLSSHISPGADFVRADPRALQQVMLNLLANAVDALKGRPGPAIDLRTELRAGRVTMRIEDNGCGMSEDQAARLFQPFNTNKPNGTGLGLVICKKMLAKMQSTIDVVSRQGAGTTVLLSLPAGTPERG